MRIKRYYKAVNVAAGQNAMCSGKSGYTLKSGKGVVLVESTSVPAYRRWLCAAAKK